VAKRDGQNLRRYAVVGAEQRLLELAEEAAAIFATFPELRAPARGFMARGPAGRRPRGGDSETDAASRSPQRRRRRRKLSAEARKRISDAQKARWARQKGEPAAGGRAPKKR
jgi:hypothetical protein